MFIQRTHTNGKNGKVYHSTLLVHKYRENGVPKTKVLANLSMLPEEVILSMKNTFDGDKNTTVSLSDFKIKQSSDFGFIATILEIMNRLRINELFDKVVPKLSNIAQLLIIGKIVTRGSKLNIFNWIQRNPKLAEILKIDLKELELKQIYQSLGQLPEYQSKINRKWALYNQTKDPKKIFLYDITSTYLEGTKNALAKPGYNRDKKKGKLQITIGLITDSEGFPLKIEAFEGNMNDYKTVVSQITTLKKEFNADKMVFVGDRGMRIEYNLNTMQELEKEGVQYITGLTKDEIKQMISKGVIQLDLFSETIVEVQDGVDRYILSLNPVLSKENKKFRDKMRDLTESDLTATKLKFETYLTKFQNNREKLNNGHKNKKLVTEFSQKKLDAFKINVSKILEKRKTKSYYEVEITPEKFEIKFDVIKYTNDNNLDGKYVIHTTVPQNEMNKEQVREHYKKLQHVEHAFRDMKTVRLDIRPVYHINESTTRGHVLITMFAYAVIHQIEKCIFPFLKEFNNKSKQQYSYKDVEAELNNIKIVEYNIGYNINKFSLTEFTDQQTKILDALKISEKHISNYLCS